MASAVNRVIHHNIRRDEMNFTSLKRSVAVFAATATLAIAGLSGEARAFSFTDGDLVLAIYGNGVEALYNLGHVTNGVPLAVTDLDVSAGLTAAGGANPVKYTVFGNVQS